MKLVQPKGNHSWIFIGRTDAEAETPTLWPPNAKKWLVGKDPHSGKDWRQEEKGTTEGEMVGWHYRLDGHEFEQAPGVGDGQGSLACCSPWGDKESDVTERLNWTQGEGGDSPDREGIQEEGALTLRTARWAWVRQREEFLCKKGSLCKRTLSAVQGAGVSAAGTERGDPRGPISQIGEILNWEETEEFLKLTLYSFSNVFRSQAMLLLPTRKDFQRYTKQSEEEVRLTP